MRKMIRKGVNIDKLAQKVASKNREDKKLFYKQGSAEEKVWINFQASKALKREFNRICTENTVNASAFLRTCIKLLIENEGDIRKTLNIVKPSKEETLESKEKD